MAAAWFLCALVAAATVAATVALSSDTFAKLKAMGVRRRALQSDVVHFMDVDDEMMAGPRGAPLLASRFDEVFAWRHADYALPQAERQRLLGKGAAGGLVPGRCMPLGFDVWRDRLFLTTPRRKAGVPVALGYIRVDDKERSPKVIPYPDYETNQLPPKGLDQPKDDAPARIASAYRIRVDACDRLWVADSGRADAGDGDGHVLYSTPQVLVFNLTTDKLIRRFFLRPEHFTKDSFFATVTVDVTKNKCEDAFAYVADLGQPGLVVYSLKQNDAWRVKNAYFYADPLATNYDVDGLQFQLLDGVITATPGDLRRDGYRTVYFHPLSSFSEFAISTKILQSKELATAPKVHLEYTHLGSRGRLSQSSASFFHEKTGVLFFTEVMNHAVTCWNTRSKPQIARSVDVVAVDNATRGFIYPGDIKVDAKDNVWVLSTNLPGYIFGDLDPKQFNHFIYKTKVKTAIQGTKCDTKMPSGGSHHHDHGHHHQHSFPAECCGQSSNSGSTDPLE